jgi:hypothetical protein
MQWIIGEYISNYTPISVIEQPGLPYLADTFALLGIPDLPGRERGTGASAAGRIRAIRPIEHPAGHLSARDQTKTLSTRTTPVSPGTGRSEMPNPADT